MRSCYTCYRPPAVLLLLFFLSENNFKKYASLPFVDSPRGSVWRQPGEETNVQTALPPFCSLIMVWFVCGCKQLLLFVNINQIKPACTCCDIAMAFGVYASILLLSYYIYQQYEYNNPEGRVTSTKVIFFRFSIEPVQASRVCWYNLRDN